MELRVADPEEGVVERTVEEPLRTAVPLWDLATDDEVDPLRTEEDELDERTVLPVALRTVVPLLLRTAVEPLLRTVVPEERTAFEVAVLVTASAEVLPTRVALEDLLTVEAEPVDSPALVAPETLDAPTRLTLVAMVPIPSPRRPPTVLVLGVQTTSCQYPPW